MREEDFNFAALVDNGVTLEVEKRMVVTLKTGDIRSDWAVGIYRNRLTKAGNPGKPEYVTALVARPGESPADLLRQLATLYDAGPVEVER